MQERVLASVLANPRIEPHLAIWGWQIAAYLFLGGVVAGLMVLTGWAILAGREQQTPFASRRAPLISVVLLGIGMLMLFLDLQRKINILHFYMTFRVTSPMSWGAWILIAVVPVLALLTLAGLPEGFPPLARWLGRLPVIGPRLITPLYGLSFAWRRVVAPFSIALGIALGIYTGVLLSGFNARPFWHSALLGPLFLVSGVSTGAAVMVLGAATPAERHLFSRIDLGLIVAELAVVALFFIDMLDGSALQQSAIGHLLGGDQTRIFWIGFIGIGLLVPLLLEAATFGRSVAVVVSVAAVLVLGGGYLLRDIAVKTGQETTWTQFHNQFNASLLSRLRTDGENPNGRF